MCIWTGSSTTATSGTDAAESNPSYAITTFENVPAGVVKLGFTAEKGQVFKIEVSYGSGDPDAPKNTITKGAATNGSFTVAVGSAEVTEAAEGATVTVTAAFTDGSGQTVTRTVTAREGSFDRDNQAADDADSYLSYFQKPGAPETDTRIWTYDAKTVVVTGVPEGADIQLISYAGDDVAFTLDTHGENYLTTQEGKHLPVPHCLRGSEGWTLYGETGKSRRQADPALEKPAFPSLELGTWLREKGYDRVELVGLVSYICVLSNAVIAKAALPEAEIVVDAACTAGPDLTLHEKALDLMETLQIAVTNR